jgi:RNA polymerase sigma-70 factor (ECF subfamily)
MTWLQTDRHRTVGTSGKLREEYMMAPEELTQSSPHAEATEQELVQRVQTGDAAAFDALFHQCCGKVFHQATRFLGNAAEAEEVVQEVFLAVYEKAHTFRGDATFSTWLFRLTANAALSRLRRRKRGKEVAMEEYLPRFRPDGHHLVRPVVDWSANLEERLADAQLQQLLREAIELLQPLDKAVLVLSDFEDLSNKEIGEALGLTVPAVKARLHRARLILRGQLAVACGYSPT